MNERRVPKHENLTWLLVQVMRWTVGAAVLQGYFLLETHRRK